jgi:hypothetical protein
MRGMKETEMTDKTSRFNAVALLCWVIPLTLNFAAGLLATQGQELSAGLQFIGFLVTGWAFGWWLRRDNRLLSLHGVQDVGYAACVAWMFLLPYYLLKTRGVKALLTIGVFVTVYFAALGAGIVAGLLWVG